MTIDPISFRALQAVESTPGNFELQLITHILGELKDDEILIRVYYSSLNYKDVLSAGGNRGVTKNCPHIPGIDASGVIQATNSREFAMGDEVIVTGFDFGMNTDGGFAEYIIVPAAWVVKLPEGLTLKTSMIYGTAGFTAGLSVAALIRNGVDPEDGLVAVSGATGGVGSVAVAILSKLGYKVAAISSKEAAEYLTSIGATEIIPRTDMEDHSGKVLLKPRFAAAIDTVGGARFERFFRILTQNGFDMFQRRVTSNLSKTAEQRYREFRRHYPGLEQRISQKHIASYLGITAAFLSMMRKKETCDLH